MSSFFRLKAPLHISHAFWGVMDAALYPLGYVVAVPFLIKGMGLTTFGIWILFNTVIAVFQLFNFNLGTTTLRNLAFEIASGDSRRVKDVADVVLHLTVVLFLFALVVGFGLSFLATQYNWWDVESVVGNNVFGCFMLTACIAGIKYFDQIFQSIFKSYERFRLASILNIINRFGLLLITVVLAVNGCNLFDILLWNLIFACSYLIVQFLFVNTLIPQYAIGRVEERQHYRQLLNFGIWAWLQSLCVVVAFQTDRFWVSAFDLPNVAGYSFSSTIFNHVYMIFTAMVVWTFPRMSFMTSQGTDTLKFYETIQNALVAIVIGSLLTLYFISPWLFSWWLGDENASQVLRFVHVFIAFNIVFTQIIMPVFYLNAAGKPRAATYITLLFSGGCYVSLIAALILSHHSVYAITSMTLAMCVVLPVIIVLVQKHMNIDFEWSRLLMEVAPVYLGVAIVYSTNSVLTLALCLCLGLILWRNNMSTIFNYKSWKRSFGL